MATYQSRKGYGKQSQWDGSKAWRHSAWKSPAPDETERSWKSNGPNDEIWQKHDLHDGRRGGGQSRSGAQSTQPCDFEQPGPAGIPVTEQAPARPAPGLDVPKAHKPAPARSGMIVPSITSDSDDEQLTPLGNQLVETLPTTKGQAVTYGQVAAPSPPPPAPAPAPTPAPAPATQLHFDMEVNGTKQRTTAAYHRGLDRTMPAWATAFIPSKPPGVLPSMQTEPPGLEAMPPASPLVNHGILPTGRGYLPPDNWSYKPTGQRGDFCAGDQMPDSWTWIGWVDIWRGLQPDQVRSIIDTAAIKDMLKNRQWTAEVRHTQDRRNNDNGVSLFCMSQYSQK